MGIVVDAISGSDIARVVNLNINGAVDLSDKGVNDFFNTLAASLSGKKIEVLRIWGHGTTHYTDGGPYNKGNFKLGQDQIDFDTVDKFTPGLSILTPLLETRSRVELRGCQAALTSGARMMLKLANIWKSEVQASDRSQPLLTWTPPVYSAWPGATSLAGANMIEYNDQRYKR
jgi:hypothetical protein